MDKATETTNENETGILTIDYFASKQLYEAARWAKFLAVLGFIGCGLIFIFGFGIVLLFSSVNSFFSTGVFGPRITIHSGRSVHSSLLFFPFLILLFFRFLFLYRFAVKMQLGLRIRSQIEVNDSFRNLKKLFRYIAFK